ncbi:DNA-methyltransferase [Methylorubrum extorquens]|uniref:DNA-methyltransferase n=1 Tax=Methylorubrum extorquens TaxID=408 RepID=UPI002238CC44|nr:site-specific DNA-methyltransferase [Methylorubrum extorquens]UYW33671.1 site-specific DNA-methyltransferase [Methylorubrum extorquens]
MSVRILTGDCRDVLRELEPFDCIVTDPPYGETSFRWDQRVPGWPALVRPLLKPTGSMWVFGSLRFFMETAVEFLETGWRLSQDIIWEKQNGSGFAADRFRRVHEQGALFYRDDAPWSGVYKLPQVTHDAKARKVRQQVGRTPHTGTIGPNVYESEAGGPRLMRSVMYVRNGHRQGTGHGTPKPEELLEPLLRYACPPGGRVLDPFAGSGSTGLVASRLGLDCTLIEADPATAEAAAARLARDGGMFANLAAE